MPQRLNALIDVLGDFGASMLQGPGEDDLV